MPRPVNKEGRNNIVEHVMAADAQHLFLFYQVPGAGGRTTGGTITGETSLRQYCRTGQCSCQLPFQPCVATPWLGLGGKGVIPGQMLVSAEELSKVKLPTGLTEANVINVTGADEATGGNK